MGDKVNLVLKQCLAFWRSLSLFKRIALVTCTLGVLLGVLLLSSTDYNKYTYLYTELPPRDAAAIVDKLEKAQIPYQLENGGTAIKVPDERVYQLRLQLAAEGLPSGGGVGFEIFDKNQIGSTEFEQQVNLRRALEGELARSIATVDGVASARVHLVMVNKRLFADKGESASASVVLKLKDSKNFGRTEVAAIVHLVAAAVPGLSRDRISVVSTDGVTLHRPSAAGGANIGDLAQAQADQSREVASQLQNHVREQLEQVVGPGNADVRINVELEPATRERTEEHYEPSKTALRSEHKVEEATGAGDPGVAGVPGARTNLPDALPEGEPPALAAPAGGLGGSNRRSQTRNWEVDRVTERISTPPGEIRRLSVAVVLNGDYKVEGEQRTFRPRSKEELDNLEQLVRRAVGYDEKRGDSVEVKGMQFADIQALGKGELASAPPVWARWIPHVLTFAAALALLIVFLSFRAKPAKKPAGVNATAQLTEGASPDTIAQLQAERRAKLLEAPPEDRAAFREHALSLASKDPATAAVVLKKWLNAPVAQAGDA